jgi:hypothetical protein
LRDESHVCYCTHMTKKPSTAQLALLDQIAATGSYHGQQRRTAEVLRRNGWIEQRVEGRKGDGLDPWYLTWAGSDAREAAQQ